MGVGDFLVLLVMFGLLVLLLLSTRGMAGRFWAARARRRESLKRIYRDGMICIRCGYNMRANPSKCSECGYEPAGDV